MSGTEVHDVKLTKNQQKKEKYDQQIKTAPSNQNQIKLIGIFSPSVKQT